MAFFQNVFLKEFRGNWVLGDRQYSLTFICPPNQGRGDKNVIAWNKGTYDLSIADADGNARTNLDITFSFNQNNYKNWNTISINVAGLVPGSTSAVEIATKLNANTTFTTYFSANVVAFPTGEDRISIVSKNDNIKFYVVNGKAEEAIQFNARAGVTELPDYFNRHTMAERFNFEDGVNELIKLDPAGSVVDSNVIANAVDASGNSLGYDPSIIQPDWQLLKGRSGIFNFQIITLTTAGNIGEIKEFPAGAKEGDFGRMIVYNYAVGAIKGDNPTRIWEIPYTLTSGDVSVTPP